MNVIKFYEKLEKIESKVLAFALFCVAICVILLVVSAAMFYAENYLYKLVILIGVVLNAIGLLPILIWHILEVLTIEKYYKDKYGI